MMKMKIAIVGKTNTGKSSLFNRLVGYRKAIVLEKAGITRDRNYAEIDLGNNQYIIIDTGGIDYNQKDFIQQGILEQTKKAIIEADLIIFLLDLMTGIQQEDLLISNFIRKNDKKTILVVNKDDVKEKNYFPSDFYSLGFGEPCVISAEQGRNTNDLLEKIIKMTPIKVAQKSNLEDRISTIKVAIAGRPNVGKSSLLNAFLNEDRVIVDEHPGTTRDSIKVSMDYGDFRLEFIDTSGLRRKSNVTEKIEYYGNKRTLNSISEADIVLLVLDATCYISMQDKRIARKILEEKKGCIVLLNKYDLIMKEKSISIETLMKMSRFELRFLKDTPIITTIAIGEKKNLPIVFESIVDIYKIYSQELSTPQINKTLQTIISQNPPKVLGKKRIHFYYMTQVKTKPPTFRLFVNDPAFLYDSYQKYLENQFAKEYEFKGIPITFYYQKRNRKE